MATLTFRVGDHIIFICYLKNHMIWFCDFRSKLIGNILKIFLISSSKICKLVFLESSAENIENATFYYLYSNMFLFCFFALVYTLNHTFSNKTTVWQKSIKALFYSELKKIYHTLKLAKLVSRPIHRVKINKLNS
jgi:hypothetical protein